MRHRVPGVVADPTPISFIKESKESGIAYKLKFYLTDYAHLDRIEGEVMAYVWYAFQRNACRGRKSLFRGTSFWSFASPSLTLGFL